MIQKLDDSFAASLLKRWVEWGKTWKFLRALRAFLDVYRTQMNNLSIFPLILVILIGLIKCPICTKLCKLKTSKGTIIYPSCQLLSVVLPSVIIYDFESNNLFTLLKQVF